MWICGIATDVADNAKVSLGNGEGCCVKERWNWVGEVYAVDEDVRIDDFRIRTWFGGCFLNIPFGNLRVWETGSEKEVDGSATTTALDNC